VSRTDVETPIRTILVALDGSTGGQHALNKAIRLARSTGATLTALAVEGPLPRGAATVGEIDDALERKNRFFAKVVANAEERAEAAGVEITVDIRAGRPAPLILSYAESCRADVIVVGHSRHLLEDLLPASTADRVAHRAGCPVMVVT
jgi:nucleotide-binding universal stress UspA family protein